VTIRTLNWCTPDKLDCESSIPATAYICVPASIVDPTPSTPNGVIEATITGVRASTCADPCGLCKWVYTISYDDEQLVAGYVLVDSYIKSVLCGNCITDFVIKEIEAIPSPNVLGRVTLDLNDPTVQTVTLDTSNYVLFGDQRFQQPQDVWFLNPSVSPGMLSPFKVDNSSPEEDVKVDSGVRDRSVS